MDLKHIPAVSAACFSLQNSGRDKQDPRTSGSRSLKPSIQLAWGGACLAPAPLYNHKPRSTSQTLSNPKPPAAPAPAEPTETSKLSRCARFGPGSPAPPQHGFTCQLAGAARGHLCAWWGLADVRPPDLSWATRQKDPHLELISCPES